MRQQRRHLSALTLILALGCLACSNEIAPTLACGGLRKVRLGMSTEDVRQILGSPLDRFTEKEMGARQPDSVFHPDLEWAYSRRAQDARFMTRNVSVEFKSGRVGRVHAGARRSWGTWASYGVSAEGNWETPDFNERFCR